VKLASVAPRKPDGTPDLAQSLTKPDLKLLVSAVLDKCDALDGLKDGLIFNPEACHFDPAVLRCKAGQTSRCLPAEKVNVIDAIFKGPHDESGKAIYSTWPYDSGDSAEGWRIWMTGLGPVPSINVMIFPPFFNGLALAGAPPHIDIFTSTSKPIRFASTNHPPKSMLPPPIGLPSASAMPSFFSTTA
jgi:feruloyl esterase